MNRARRQRSRPPIWSPEGIEPLVGMPVSVHLRTIMPASGRGPLPRGGRPYPDRPELEPGAEGWFAQAFEGVLTFKGRSTPSEAPALAAAAVREACRVPLGTSLVHLAAERFDALSAPDEVDQLLEALRDAPTTDRERLAALGRWMCEFGVTMNQLKVSIAVLGISGTPRDAALITRLGLYDILTLYAVVALRNLLDDPDQAVFDLAKQSSGWGRIQALRRLVGAADPAIRDWILRGGYDSGVIVEETAYIGAIAGGLALALQGRVDEELLDHAGILLAALANGGPAEDMSDYSNGEFSMQLYLNEMATAPASFSRLFSLNTLHRYLEGGAQTNPRLDASSRTRLARQAADVLARPEWRDLVTRALYSDSLADVRRATPMCSRFGLDPSPILRQWLDRAPHDPYLWSWLAGGADRDELLELLRRADTLLPIRDLPAGAAEALALGPGTEPSQCFESLLQALERFPSDGWPQIRVGFRSRYVRGRTMALKALAGWPRDAWPADAVTILRECASVEPDPKVRARFLALAGHHADGAAQ